MTGTFGASIGNSLGQGTGNAAGDTEGTRWPAPAWKLGLRASDDRGDI
jgi:hypothetical protein